MGNKNDNNQIKGIVTISREKNVFRFSPKFMLHLPSCHFMRLLNKKLLILKKIKKKSYIHCCNRKIKEGSETGVIK